MSEPRKINIGGGHRSAPSTSQNVYHAGEGQAAAERSVNTGAASAASAQASEAAAREAARRRYEQQRAASQRGYADASRLEEARARARADAEAARLRRSQQFPRVQQTPASGARVQHLDLSRAQGSKPMYDINNDAEFEARQRRRAQAQQSAAAPARSAQPASSAQPSRTVNRTASAGGSTSSGRTIHRAVSGQAAARAAQAAVQPSAQSAAADTAAAPSAAAAQAARSGAGHSGSGAASSSARPGASAGAAGGKPPKGPGRRGKKGGGDDGSGKGKNGKRKRKVTWWKILLGTLLVIVLIFAGTIGVIMNAIRPKGGSLSISELINTPKGLDGQQLNILVLGVDRSAQGGDMAAGSTNDSEANDGNTDMIMYVQLDFVNNEVRMLQIPRNILVTTDYDVSHNYQINNVAITQGSNGNNNYDALCTLINEQLGLYIDGYVAIRLEALVELVDTLGPIQVYVPQEITYTDKNGNVTSHLDQGLQWMDGATAEFFLRARKTYAQSDIQRLNVQRYFYSAMFARLRAMTVWDVAKILPVVMNYMETSLDVQELVSAAVSLLKVSSDHIMLCQVPVYMGQLFYQENDIDVIYRQGTADLLNQYFRTPETQMTADQLNICDDVVDVGNREPTDPNVQYMGTLNQDVVESASESGVETDPNATYDLPTETAAPEGEDSTDTSGSTDSSDSSSDEADDAA